MSVGFLAYGGQPSAIVPPMRRRALLAEAALQSAALSFFADDDCYMPENRIDAEIWTGTGWDRSRSTVPDVVIALNAPRRPGELAVAEWIASQTTVIDDHGPDKLELAEMLSATHLSEHVIPSVKLSLTTMRDTLGAWLARRRACVVKATNGHRGGGIHFLQPESDGTWWVRKYDEAIRADAVDAVGLVCRRIAGRMRYRDYLVQSYIVSLTADGRAFDCRVHIQRRATGAWGLTRLYVRLGEVGTLLSNVSRGGYQGQVLPFLMQRRVRRPENVLADMETLAFGVAHAIEQRTGRDLSELGVDIAIDEHDRLWLLEANVRPQSSLHEHERAVHTIGYGIHVAERGRLLHRAN